MSARFIFTSILVAACAAASVGAPKGGSRMLIGNYLTNSPGGIAFVADNSAGFALNVGWGTPGTAAPDNSIHKVRFSKDGANVDFIWGRTGDCAVAKITSDKPVSVQIKLTPSWPKFETSYSAVPGGADGVAKLADGSSLKWALRTSPAPAKVEGGGREAAVTVDVAPAKPVCFAAGTRVLPAFEKIDAVLSTADKAYAAKRASASGDWGDFVGAIADNLNNSRCYSSDEKLVAHTVSRGWCPNPDRVVYFCWDSFFNGLLASIEDPEVGRNTVRAILGHQTKEGLIPNFANWEFQGNQDSTDRSQPPVGSMCVWKMYQRWPDKTFLSEVYPKLVKWHKWWPGARDGNKNGLLEWGSSTGQLQGALWETGWDDTPHFEGAKMVGPNMNVDAVDLNSLWAADAEYLALIAGALGKKQDAKEFADEHAATVKRMNAELWNDELGVYCSKSWDGHFLTRLTPMNFYPMIAGVPDTSRAGRMLKMLTDPKKFWGPYLLPTVAYDDPSWPQQHYWRGKVWAPTNYLTFQGLKRYGTPAQVTDYARRSVSLFMKPWLKDGVCSENYLSTDGSPSSDRHYTWGALLDLIGVEAVCDITADGRVKPGSGFAENVVLRHLPVNGKLRTVTVKGGRATVK